MALMFAVTPACSQTHWAKSEHHSSFSFSTLNAGSYPQPSLFGVTEPTSVV